MLFIYILHPNTRSFINMEVDDSLDSDRNGIHTIQARLISDTGEEAGKSKK